MSRDKLVFPLASFTIVGLEFDRLAEAAPGVAARLVDELNGGEPDDSWGDPRISELEDEIERLEEELEDLRDERRRLGDASDPLRLSRIALDAVETVDALLRQYHDINSVVLGSVVDYKQAA